MRKKLRWIILILLVLVTAFLIYTGNYYHADDTARSAMITDGSVAVVQTDYGWLFDGPSEDAALIFYPGAKVEAEAYAPMLRMLAGQGMDVCLIRMPFHLAFFGMGRAGDVTREHQYSRWYIGGHSLGGAMAANYAAGHSDELAGVILFAAYPTKPLAKSLTVISIYGTEDGVLRMGKVTEGRSYAQGPLYEYAIEGGNHAGFGCYGEQKGDGEARISAEEQQQTAVEYIMQHLSAGE